MICLFCFSCVGRQTYTKHTILEDAAEPMRVSDVGFSKRYGTNSECLVLMEGPVPSRMEPCVVGDFRSAKSMYKETEVTVSGEGSQFEWQITGVVYSPFVNETYYQNEILYRGSFFRRLAFDGYSPTRSHYHYTPYMGGWGQTSRYYRSYYGGYSRLGR